MGAQKPVDGLIRPLEISPLQTLTLLTPAQATDGRSAGSLGYLPIGNYKGNAAFTDLDKAVNQPLVNAEKAHILGILDGREEDYDLQTLAVTLAEAIGAVHTAALTVPAGAVWFVHAIRTTLPASGGANIVTANWACSLWTDRLAAATTGQTYHGAALNFGAAGGVQLDEFNEAGLIIGVANKPTLLRLPAGAILTITFTNTVAVAAGTVNCTFEVEGYVGKVLVA